MRVDEDGAYKRSILESILFSILHSLLYSQAVHAIHLSYPPTE
jgi:hypothetical protein